LEVRVVEPLIQIHRLSTTATAIGSPKKRVSATGALVAILLGLHPSFGSHITPLGYGPQDYLFAHGNGEIVDVLTGKFVTFVTTLIAFFRVQDLIGHVVQ
jgi:hypothetical protein